MKFEFPKKEKLPIIELEVSQDFFNEITGIAVLQECTVPEAIMTFLNAAIPEYYKEIGNEYERTQDSHSEDRKLENTETTGNPGKNKVIPEKDTFKKQNDRQFNAFGSALQLNISKEKKISFEYCQNAECPKPNRKYVAGTGVTSIKMKFCTWNCADDFIKRNNLEPRNR